MKEVPIALLLCCSCFFLHISIHITIWVTFDNRPQKIASSIFVTYYMCVIESN